jgi:hypothetical protein
MKTETQTCDRLWQHWYNDYAAVMTQIVSFSFVKYSSYQKMSRTDLGFM